MADKETAGRCPCCHGTGERRLVNPQWLREKRQGAGLSLREVARRLELSAPYISDIERGHRHAPAAVVKLYERL